ncbi:MAG: hypothetical protein KGL39_31280 [Patescibacteria group bacterium]|nr:hypothetical protein [Patescibacteria group bacterium]
MSLFGSQGDGGAAALEKKRQAGITAGMREINQDFAGFTPDFYDKVAQNYTAATTPAMMQDYQATKNNLTYALARNGILNSGAAVQRNKSLQGQLAQNETQISNNAQNQSNTLQANVNTQKGQLVGQLESSADPASIGEQATAATSQLRADSPIQPLGNLFSNWSQQYLAGGLNNAISGNPTNNIWNNLMGNAGYTGMSNSSSFVN